MGGCSLPDSDWLQSNEYVFDWIEIGIGDEVYTMKYYLPHWDMVQCNVTACSEVTMWKDVELECARQNVMHAVRLVGGHPC